MNITKIMQQAQAMQQKLETLKEEAAGKEFIGAAGAGAVEVTINGGGDLLKVNIEPSLLVPDEKEVLEDLLVAAFNKAKKDADDASSGDMADAMKGMGLPAGMKLPF